MSSFSAAGQSDHTDGRQEIGTIGNIFYDKSAFVIGDMIILKKLRKILRILTGQGVSPDRTAFQSLFQSILFFLQSLTGSPADPGYKQRTDKNKKNHREKKLKASKKFFSATFKKVHFVTTLHCKI